MTLLEHATAEVTIDFDPVGLVLTACRHCPTWRAELLPDDAGGLVLREWHRASCPEAVGWADDEPLTDEGLTHAPTERVGADGFEPPTSCL